jgi:hypothetical protein
MGFMYSIKSVQSVISIWTSICFGESKVYCICFSTEKEPEMYGISRVDSILCSESLYTDGQWTGA